ncbi:MAG TPA: hypothetical protein VMB79_08420 [Jatrophihabitans sp.]|nr:hypothetical protein [Jatrophihabitans sp.]
MNLHALRATARRGRRRLTAFLLAALVAAVGLLASAPAAHASGASTITSWYQPSIYNVRTISNGTTFTAGVLSSTITEISGSLQFTTQPSGMVYGAYLCLDSADTQCLNVGPPSYSPNSSGWMFDLNVSSLALPATTTFHLAAFIDDGSTGNILVALNPPRSLTSKQVVIRYT